MKKIYVALLGHGTVGSGVAEILTQKASFLKEQTGCEIVLKSILDKRSFPKAKYRDLFVGSIDDILGDKKISVVAEAMGGVEPAFEWCLRALESGKNVVTSNKELVCEKGTELLAAAEKSGVQFLFEASVGGGMPCLRMIRDGMAASGIRSVTGILNGTTNYILSRMTSDGLSYSAALSEAQSLGYAESDPTNDVRGYDAARKIAIIASMVWKKRVPMGAVATLGIAGVTASDIMTAKSLGLTIKLVANAQISKKGVVTASVMPTLVDGKSPLAAVSGCDNLVNVISDTNSPVTMTGAGAGKMPTASAVVSDICDIAMEKKSFVSWKEDPNAVAPTSEYKQNYLFVVPTMDLEELRSFCKGLKIDYRLQPSPPSGGYLLMASNLGLTGYEFLRNGLKKFGTPILGFPVIM